MQSFFKFILIVSVITITSCAKDTKTEDSSSNPNTPIVDDREKFVGVWNANENSAVGGSGITYTVLISKSGISNTEITIGNFASLQTNARAVVNNTLLTIPYQTIAGGFVVGGSGIYSANNVVDLTYTLNINGRDSSVTKYTKP